MSYVTTLLLAALVLLALWYVWRWWTIERLATLRLMRAKNPSTNPWKRSRNFD